MTRCRARGAKVTLAALCLLAGVCGYTQTNPPAQPAQPQMASPSAPNMFFDWSNLVFNGLTAVGTVVVAILAVFGQRIRAWFVRPRLALAVGKTSPFVDRAETIDASASNSKRVSYAVRLQVINDGKETARNCKILCDSVYQEREKGSGFYLLRRFVPKEFFWTGSAQSKDVVPKLPSYVDIASIAEPVESASASVTSGTEQPKHALHILIEAEGTTGRYFCVGVGKFIYPLILYADNLPRPTKRYVEILWTGKAASDFGDACFDVRLLNEDEGYDLVGGAS